MLFRSVVEFLDALPTLGMVEADVHRYEVTGKQPMS